MFGRLSASSCVRTLCQGPSGGSWIAASRAIGGYVLRDIVDISIIMLGATKKCFPAGTNQSCFYGLLQVTALQRLIIIQSLTGAVSDYL